MKNHVVILWVAVVLLAFSCKPKTEEKPIDFDKASLLTNVGTNIIIPEYQQLLNDIQDFETAYGNFSSDISSIRLIELQNAWQNAYLQWQKVMMYDFGPAMSYGLKSALGTFPTDTLKLLNNISSGSYVLSAVSNIDAIGFSAFDFLLYRTNALSYFNSNLAYVNYGLELIQKMKNEVSTVLSNWKSTYLSQFISSTGTESTSAFSLFVNEYLKTYEQTKWAKVGIPLGKQTLGIQQPDYIECRKSKIGLEILKQNIIAFQRIFNGKQFDGNSGVGFDDYLLALDKGALSSTINGGFDQILADIDAITLNFEAQMNSNPAVLDALFTKIHNLTVLLKTDMTAAFGVLITYQDNDGD